MGRWNSLSPSLKLSGRVDIPSSVCKAIGFMSLRSLDLPPYLDTSISDVDRTLLNPCLSVSSAYERGVGYFTSTWLRHVAYGLADFASNGGRMRLITSHKLAPEDCAALQEGEDARDNPVLVNALREEIEELSQFALERPVQMLAWMVADGLLEVRIAIPTGKLDGDYHPKMGCFTDKNGDHVVFHGSQNETERGFRNFETIDIFHSWLNGHDATRVENHRTRFRQIWSGFHPHLRCYRLPDAIRRNLVRFCSERSRPYRVLPGGSVAADKWRHQERAMEKFLDKQAGILEMATGTGKTRTALKIAQELIQRDLIDSIVVTTGGSDLLDQWYKALAKDGPSWPRYRFDGRHKDGGAYLGQPKGKILIASRTMVSDVLERLPQNIRNRTLIVVDEVHGLGSPGLRRTLAGLLSSIRFRLGLSATPERDYDQVGNDFIASEIGPVIFSFELPDAISCGVLCEFDYQPLRYVLSEEDKAQRAKLIRAHEAAKRAGNARPDEELYRALADVKKASRQKLPVLREFLESRPHVLERSLVFVPTKAYGEIVQRIISDYTDDFHPYFTGDHRDNLQRFADGQLSCLLTCHRLSEGIDIQSVRAVILLSADRAKIETIQRLGRCLRTDETDEGKRALVVDFLCEEDSVLDDADRVRSDWISEMARTRRVE